MRPRKMRRTSGGHPRPLSKAGPLVGESRPLLAVLARSDRRLSKALRLHVPSDVPPGPGGLLGLELEFSVRSVRGGQVHFGSLIHRLALDGAALDPGDPNAYRCSWGGVTTADGAEAEIVTPPVRARPGFTARLQAWAQTGEAELRRAMPRGIELDGYSAHFSAAMPAELNDRVCRLYAQTFAADLMLLMDRADSPGLLVRPRPGRTELCGEFIENEPLAAAAAFVAGSTRACAAAVRRPSARAALPPRLDVRLARAVHRYGWYVDRGAFGTDLHAASRRALLRRASGGTICAQSHLELAWAAAREALADDAAASDLQAAEAMVTGSLPLPAEHGQPDDPPDGQHGGDVPFPLDGTAVPDTPRLCAHVRPGFVLRPVAATWDFTVFEAIGPARSAYACIPRDSLPGFVAALEKGALDDPIAAYLALTSRRRVLSAPEQTRRPGLYDQMDAPAELLAPERDPQTGRQESGVQGAKHTLVRPGKRNRQEQQEQAAPRKAPRFVPRAAAIAVAAAVVVAALAAVLTRHGSTPPVTLPAVTGVSPAGGITTGGTTVTITGTGLADATLVSFGGVAGRITARSGTQITVASPPSTGTVGITVTAAAITADSGTRITGTSPPGTGPVDITVTTPAGTSKPTAADHYTYTAPRPAVTGISPDSGSTAGGTTVSITGTGLAGATGVRFGAIAGRITADSNTQVTVTSPPGTGTVTVTVTTPAGTSKTAAAGHYTYTARPKQAQSISFTAPASATAGDSATLLAKGGGSGNPVVFSVDRASGPGVCTLSGRTVTYTAAGPCVIDANQVGNATYAAAAQAQQMITVTGKPQSITFTNPPSSGTVGDSATLSASGGGSGNPVVLSVDHAAARGCAPCPAAR